MRSLVSLRSPCPWMTACMNNAKSAGVVSIEQIAKAISPQVNDFSIIEDRDARPCDSSRVHQPGNRPIDFSRREYAAVQTLDGWCIGKGLRFLRAAVG